MNFNQDRVRTVAWLLLVTCGLSACTGALRAPGADSLTEASRAAEEENRILLAYFTATWCVPCRLMVAETWNEARVQEWVERHGRFLSVDFDRHSAIAESHGVDGPPVTIAFRGGEELDRLMGYRDADEFLQWLNDLLEGTIRLGRLQRTLAEQEHAGYVDSQLRYALAEELARHGRYDDAAEQYAILWTKRRDENDGRVNLALQVPWDMRKLVRAQPPTAERFGELRVPLEAAVEDGSADAEAVEDWVMLSAIVRDQEAMVAWMDSLADEELNQHRGLLEYLGGEEFYGWGDLYKAAVDLGRWDVVLRLRENRAERWYGRPDIVYLNRRFQQSYARRLRQLSRRSHDEMRATMRYEAATMHAASLAAGRDADARDVADVLLSRLNDGESRLALVEQAARAGEIRQYHRIWLAEARVRQRNQAERIAKIDAMIGALASGG